MTSVIIDKTLEFSFPSTWHSTIYENSKIRIDLHDRINSICCVDLLLLNPEDKLLFIIEAKDFFAPHNEEEVWNLITCDLIQKLAKKFVHTIAGLSCAKLCGDEELKVFYRALLDHRVKKYLVSFIEFGEFRNRKMASGQPVLANTLQKIKSTLYPVHCKKVLCDIITLPAAYGWTVARIPAV